MQSVEVPGDYSVASTLFDINTHSLVFRSALAVSGRDVVVNVGFGDVHVMRFGPTRALVDLPTDTILGSFTVFGNSGVDCGEVHSRDINKL